MDVDRAFTEVCAAAARIHDAQEAVAAAKDHLHRVALRALLDVEGDDARGRALVRRLYWEVPDLPVRTLEVVVGSAARVRQLAAPGPPLPACSDCAAERHATSRAERANDSGRCEPCERRHRQEEQARLVGSFQEFPPADDAWPSGLPPDPPEEDEEVDDPGTFP